MSSICTSNVTSGFIDLATFDELEKYCYGGPDATAYFVRETRKSTWFTQVPVVLSRASGSPAFGQEWSVSISRAGDYLLHTWLRVTTPKIVATPETGSGATAQKTHLRWTRNFMHNLVRECCITFNDLVAARFDNFHLDFWAAFTVPAGKQNGYNAMIGNFDEMTSPQTEIKSFTLNLPLPFFFCRDSGVALPTAALPYNDMRLNFNFRDWDELLIANVTGLAASSQYYPEFPWRRAVLTDISGGSAPQIGTTQVWANYAIVSNDERKRMGCAPRDILIEQVQTAPRQTFSPSSVANPQYDIRFSHAIKVLFFSCRNTTILSEWSNYTTAPPSTKTITNATVFELQSTNASDPIITTSLIYENTQRLACMGSDYFSLVNPYYFAPIIPTATGFHMYSYSLDFISLDPMGSTNYGKLTNVSIAPVASESAINASKGIEVTGDTQSMVLQTFEFITTAVNNNIIRVSGGALGFPVL